MSDDLRAARHDLCCVVCLGRIVRTFTVTWESLVDDGPGAQPWDSATVYVCENGCKETECEEENAERKAKRAL